MRLTDLRSHLQLRRSDSSYSTANLNRFINQAYLDVCSRRSWGWLRREHRWGTTATNTAVTLSAPTAGAYQQVIGGTVPDATFGKRILIDGELYRIKNVLTGPQWMLDAPYIGTTTGTPAVSILYDEIALPRSCDTVVDVRLNQDGNSLELMPTEPALMHRRTLTAAGQPTHFSTISRAPLPVPAYAPPVPTTSGSAGPLTGTYLYWTTFWDPFTGAESALSPSRSVSVAGSLVYSFTPTTGEGGTARSDFYWRLYRSKVGGSVPYLLASSSSETGVLQDSFDDQELGPRAVDSANTQYLQLYPAPSGTYQVSVLYQAQAWEMDDDEDRPLFDEVFHTVILDGAEALMLEAHDEQGRAGSARQRFEMGINKMVARDRSSQATLTPIASSPRARISAGVSANRWEFTD